MAMLLFALLLRAPRAAARAAPGSILLGDVEGLGYRSGSRGRACPEVLRPVALSVPPA